MPAKTHTKERPNTTKQAKATAEKNRTNAIAPPAQNNEGLPDGWRWVRLGEILKVSSGKGLKVNHLQGGEYPVYGGNGINGYHSEYLVESPKLIIGRVGVKCGVTYITKPKSWVTDNALIVEPINQAFDLKFFQLKLGYENLNKLSVSTAQPVISGSKIYAYEILLPPLEQQHAIVSKIEELLSELDKGKQQLENAQQQLKIYRQAVLKWAFEGKLSELGSVGLKDDRINDVAAKSEILQSSNPKNPNSDNLPKGWRLVQINEIAEINPKLPNKDKISNKIEVQFLPMKLVEEIINRIHLTETRKYEEVLKGSYTPFINGDVIFAKVTPCMENGKIAIVDNLKNGIGFGSSEFHVVRPRSDVNEKYLFFYLVQDRFRNEAANAMTGAVGLRRVPKQFIENHSIPLPSLDEQYFIIQQIESRLSVCDKVEETITASIAQAETLRQSILKKAFEGKLV